MADRFDFDTFDAERERARLSGMGTFGEDSHDYNGPTVRHGLRLRFERRS